MAKHTKQPEVLQELFEALGNDPFVIAECLARPALAERLLTNWYAYNQRIHGDLKQRTETELKSNPTVEKMKQLSGKYSEIELVKSDGGETVGQATRLPKKQMAGEAPALQQHGSAHTITLNSREWDEAMQKLAATFNKSGSEFTNGSDGLPLRPRDMARPGVAPYQTLPVGKLSSLQEDESRYYATAVINKTNDRLKLATVSWLKEPFESWQAKTENQLPHALGAPNPNYTLPEVSGGDCIDDTWTATAAPPDAREGHTAVWTGSEMIVWGGQDGSSVFFNSGGRYNPSTDSWTATSANNAPDARTSHSAIWTGTEMIVWGGVDENFVELNTGGRYNPGTDSWVPTSTAGVPDGRNAHTAVWAGSEMIVWGGWDGGTFFNTGGRYNPDTDSWTSTNTANAPEGRTNHTAVLIGSNMVVWGGTGEFSNALNTGGRYNLNTNSWTATSITNAPDARTSHTAVPTGTEMIV